MVAISLVATFCFIAQTVHGQGISRTFLNRTDINDKAFNAYGTVEGRTSWVRSGIGADASLDLTIEFTITNAPNSAFNAINDYDITLVLSENATDTTGEYLEVFSSGSGASVKDKVTVAISRIGYKDYSQKVGGIVPKVNSGIQNYDYRVTETSAFTSSKPSAALWKLDTVRSRRVTSVTPNYLNLVFTRSRSSPGVANIYPGTTVLGKVFISPSGSSTIYNVFDVRPQWSREFSGTGVGSIPGRSKELSYDQAIRTSVTASVFALLATMLWL